ncbi:MAG: PAS domain S-box protein, partial [Chroococcales cyanobacterium]
MTQGASLIVIVIGITVILGWAFDISVFKSVLPGMVTMKTSTAVGLILGGITLWWLQTRTNQNQKTTLILILSSFLALLGCLTLIDYRWNLPLDPDQLLFRVFPNQSNPATEGHMAPNTALDFLLLSVAFILLNRRSYYLAQLFTIVAFFVAFLALIGHIYSITLFYGVKARTGMALHTAMALMILTFGILGVSPQRGWMSHISTENAGGIMARRLLPLAISLPPILGGMILSVYQAQETQVAIAMAVFSLVNSVSFSGIIYWNAIRLNNLDTQRLYNLKALRRSERRFRAIFNQTYQLIGLLNPNGIIIELNETTLNLMGFSLHEVIGKPLWETLWQDEESGVFDKQYRLKDAIAQAATGKFVRYEIELRDRNDRIVTLDFSLKPILNASREVILLIPEARDISARKEAEIALHRREQEFKALVENSPDVIARYNRQLRNVYINPAMEYETGLPPEAFKGKTLHEMGYPDNFVAMWDQWFTEVFTTGKMILREFSYATQLHGWKTYQVRLVPEFNDRGEMETVLTITRDITERKQAEIALRQFNQVLEERIQERTAELFATKTLYESIFKHSAEAIFLVKVLPEDQFVFEAINPTDEKAIGISASEMIGKTPDEMFPSEIAEMLKRHYRIPLATGENYIYEETLELTIGTSTWRTILVPIRDETGAIIKLLGSGRNITEERKMLIALEESQNRLRDAIEYAPLPIMLHADDGEILQLNRTWTEITGYTHSQIPTIGYWTAQAYRDSERQGDIKCEIERLYQLASTTHEEEYAIATKTGETRIWDFSSSPIGYLADGRRLVISMAKDVTQRKELERSLRQTQAHVHTLVDSNIIGIEIADVEGRILQANDALLQLLGYTRQELETGEIRWDELTPPEYAARDQEVLQELQETGCYTPFEKEYFRKDGSRIPVIMGGTWLEKEEGIGVAFVLDISERKQAEIALNTRLQQQAVIVQLGELALSGMELDPLFQQATALIAHSLGVDYCKILQLLDDTEGLVLRAGVGWRPGLVGNATVDVNLESQASYTLLSYEPVIV